MTRFMLLLLRVPCRLRRWYVIYRMLTEQPHRTVIFAHYRTDMTYAIPPTGPIRFIEGPVAFIAFRGINDLITDPLLVADTLLVADSVLPPILPFYTLVISSPGRLADRNLSDRLKGYAPPRYMPIPTEAEVLAMHQVAFKELDLEGVRRRMQLWGPIPRHVLADISLDEQQMQVQRSCNVKVSVLAEAARSSDDVEKVRGDNMDATHRILHERAAGQDAEPGSPAADVHDSRFYSPGRVILASPSWLLFVAVVLRAAHAWHMAYLVDASADIGSLGTLRGIKFEEIVLNMLDSGCEWLCRELVAAGSSAAVKRLAAAGAGAKAKPKGKGSAKAEASGKGSGVLTLVVPRSPRVVFASTEELTAHRGTKSLLVPRNRNNAGLDALMWDEAAGHHVPLDATVADRHGVHAGGLAKAVSALGWTPAGGWPPKTPAGNATGLREIKYYWFVPQDQFEQGWVTAQPVKVGSDDSELAREVMSHVKQFVVCVPSSDSLQRVADECRAQGVAMPTEMLPRRGAQSRSAAPRGGGGAGSVDVPSDRAAVVRSLAAAAVQAWR